MPGLAALGVDDVEVLAGTRDPSGTLERGRVERRDGPVTDVVYPLPGTPDASGRLREAPRGAGTGEVLLRRYAGGSWRELLLARCAPPRSASLAAREWNLACHLAACGVATPQLLALGEERAPLVARRSFLVTRRPEGATLGAWLAATPPGAARRHGLAALGLALASLFRSGTHLPELGPDGVWIGTEEGCGATSPAGPALRRVRRPAVLLAGLRGGRRLRRLAPGARLEALRALLDAPLRAGALRRSEAARVALRALRHDLPRKSAHALVAAWLREPVSR